jgi:hypothetical protein
MEKFAKRRNALTADTAYFTAIIFCILWGVTSTPFAPISYAFGALFGLAYSYGLGKYVETLGGSAEDAGSVQGAGVGQARFAFLILLFVIVGKFRTQGLQELPSILGFFTYQLASLNQGELAGVISRRFKCGVRVSHLLRCSMVPGLKEFND